MNIEQLLRVTNLEQMWVMNSMNVGNRGDFDVTAVEAVSWRSLISRDELRCKIHSEFRIESGKLCINIIRCKLSPSSTNLGCSV